MASAILRIGSVLEGCSLCRATSNFSGVSGAGFACRMRSKAACDVCMYVCMYVYVCMRPCAGLAYRKLFSADVCKDKCMYVCKDKCMYVRMYVCAGIACRIRYRAACDVCKDACVYVCMHVYLC
jgi:hypothetical protein